LLLTLFDEIAPSLFTSFLCSFPLVSSQLGERPDSYFFIYLMSVSFFVHLFSRLLTLSFKDMELYSVADSIPRFSPPLPIFFFPHCSNKIVFFHSCLNRSSQAALLYLLDPPPFPSSLLQPHTNYSKFRFWCY